MGMKIAILLILEIKWK